MNPTALPINHFHWPTNWDEQFSRSGPLNIEIGFGNGQFLVNLAQRNPDENYIGLEISSPSIRNCERKITRAELENVRLVKATAQSALWLLFRPAVVSSITINFPDPWSKKSHHNRRLVSDSFLQLAATRMKTGGLLEIATDHNDYAAWIAEHLTRSAYFQNRLLATYSTQIKDRTPTKYETKALDAGGKCYYFRWSRNNILPTESYLTPEEYSMPHMVLQTPLSLEEIEDLFEAKQFVSGVTRVRFISIFHSVNERILVIDTFVHEEPLEQRLLLSIIQRQTGDLLIRVHEVGFPRSTSGIQLAVRWLGEWIEGLSRGARIVRHNLNRVG